MRLAVRWRTLSAATVVMSVAAFVLASCGPSPNEYATTGIGGDRSFAMRLGALLVCGAIGFGIGALFSPALKEFRRYGGYVLAGLILLFALFGPEPASDFVSGLAAIIVFLIALVVGLTLGARAAAAAAARNRRPTSLGSAQWATLEHLQENGVVGSGGFTLGEFVAGTGKADIHPIHYKGSRHLLTVAPTRSGKGVSSIIPNLLTYPGSAFVIDPKGENALITAGRRGTGAGAPAGSTLGQDVFLLDPWDVAATTLGSKPASFNPIDWITAGDPDAAENAFLLADALVMSESQDEGRFWDEEAKALLTGLILFVGTSDYEKDRRTLGRVRDILNLDDDDFKALLTRMYNEADPVIRSTAARQASKDTKLFSSVLATAQSHTHFLDSPRIRESLSRSDFRFEDLKAKPTSIYLILPADRLKTFDRWLRLLIQQAITVNARNVEVRPEKPILFLLDEMAALGRLPALEQAYGLMAGFGMQLWGIVQDLSQLAQVYGEHGWQTFISNSGVIQYFGSRDKMTAEYFSSLCGVTTVEIHNFSWAIGRALGWARSATSGGSGGSTTSSTSDTSSWTRTSGASEAQRQLAYPDELMVLKGNQQLVFVENLDPIPARKILWYEHPVLKKLGVNLHADE